MKVFINNLPNSLKRFVVARNCEGELWYWGTWDNVHDATAAAIDISGLVYEQDEVATCGARPM